MACITYETPEGIAARKAKNREEQRKADKDTIDSLTNMLCTVLTKIGGFRGDKKIQAWWIDHQERDKARHARDVALSKLNSEDI